ncbi:unnamed protein product [Darwinula stevensoni]|uniref:Regulatory protein zeste n=1 Tax=Darwinula stevensoni TaxID=69355 RepID=A0A7R9FT70_9CRUS|nr:unnamed protein product [Darwinula stevensoni]CAG0905229.1 unnamed protein product [Darwinula stevensoni]
MKAEEKEDRELHEPPLESYHRALLSSPRISSLPSGPADRTTPGTRTMATPASLRRKNFTLEELSVLLDEVKKRKEVLLGPITATNTSTKQSRAWEVVAFAMCSLSGIERSGEEVKTKFRQMKYAARRRQVKAVVEMKAGLPPRQPSRRDSNILEIVGESRESLRGAHAGRESFPVRQSPAAAAPAGQFPLVREADRDSEKPPNSFPYLPPISKNPGESSGVGAKSRSTAGQFQMTREADRDSEKPPNPFPLLLPTSKNPGENSGVGAKSRSSVPSKPIRKTEVKNGTEGRSVDDGAALLRTQQSILKELKALTASVKEVVEHQKQLVLLQGSFYASELWGGVAPPPTVQSSPFNPL